jgi:hypothetical protein
LGAAQAYRHAFVGNTLVGLWFGECNLETLGAFSEELSQLAARQPNGVYILNIITDTTGVPDNATRGLLQERFMAMRGRLLACAMVLEKRGIMVTLSRAILTSVMTVAKHPCEQAIFGDRGLAADWLAKRSSSPSVEKLLGATRALDPKVG